MTINTKVIDFYPLKSTDGEVGIEVELEGKFAPFPVAPSGWKSEVDNSLKGDYTIEYVTNGPIKKKKVHEAMDKLRTRIKNADVKVVPSIRTGVHVHINCQQNTFKEVYGFALTYFVMERALTKFCGPQRVGNQFCLRISDAEYLLDTFYEALTNDMPTKLKTMNIRYSSLNFLSLAKFGSIEFRAFQSKDNLEHLEEWVDILWNIREYGSKVQSYPDIAADISAKGPETWMSDIIGIDNFALVYYPEISVDIMKDLRTIQPLLWTGAEL